MALNDQNARPDEPEERPSWLIPAILTGITALVGAVILYYFIGPRPEDLINPQLRPTSNTQAVAVTIGARSFSIPQNYILRPAARAGGAVNDIELEALLPDMRGYSTADAEAFADLSRRSARVSVLVSAGAPAMNERERYERVIVRLKSPGAEPYDYQGFKVAPLGGDTGYAGQEALTREENGEFVLLICTPDDRELGVGGLCRREIAVGSDLTVRYAFRGASVERWREIDAAVRALLQRLETPQN